MSDDLARFLADRYDEAETDERALAEWAPGRELFVGTENYGEATPFRDYDPAHRLADIKLKRAILAAHPHVGAPGPEGIGCCTCHRDPVFGDTVGEGWCATARQLGTEFASHPGYRPEWAPEGEPDGT